MKLTIAHHSSELPDGTGGGNPSGFLLSLAEGNVYFACDTGLFDDMKLSAPRGWRWPCCRSAIVSRWAPTTR